MQLTTNELSERVTALIAENKRKIALIESKPPKPVAMGLDASPEYLRAARIALLRGALRTRCSELAQASIDCLKAHQPAAAVTLVRATIESVVVLYDLKLKLAQLSANRTLEGMEVLDEFLTTALFGSRRNNLERRAQNILNRIERVAKEIPAIEGVYDNLSEVAHPNSDGIVQLYLSHDESTGHWSFSSVNLWNALFVAAANLSTTLDVLINVDNAIRHIANELESA